MNLFYSVHGKLMPLTIIKRIFSDIVCYLVSWCHQLSLKLLSHLLRFDQPRLLLLLPLVQFLQSLNGWRWGLSFFALAFIIFPFSIFPHLKGWKRVFYRHNSILDSSHFSDLLSDRICELTAVLFTIGGGIGPIKESEMCFNIDVMLIIDNWSGICHFSPFHKGLAIRYETIIRVRCCKFVLSFFYPFLFIILYNIFGLIHKLHVSLGISE